MRKRRAAKKNGERTLNWQNELRDDGKDLGAAVIQEVVNATHGEDIERVINLDQCVKEQRQVVMVVELLYLHLHATTQTQSDSSQAPEPDPRFGRGFVHEYGGW